MIIVTGANSDKAKNDTGEFYKNFSFRQLIEETVRKSKECGYTPVVYDLGSLGMGKPFSVQDDSFSDKGYYEKEVIKGYKSKSLFKPAMIQTCMSEHDDFVVYLDGDALLCGNIDEISTDDYDVGVTLRDRKEMESEWHQEHFEIVKYVNAGVIFFNPTEATKNFLSKWRRLTDDVGNDQMALNQLVCPDYFPDANSIIEINGVRVKFFPGTTYNYYYFDEMWSPNVKIMHFKGSVRHYYPFDWKKGFYCRWILPVKNFLRKLKK